MGKKSKAVSSRPARGVRKDDRAAPYYQQILNGGSLVLADIGARAGVDPPWSKVENLVKFVLFEPDVEEAGKLQKEAGSGSTVIPRAIWSKTGKQTFHLTQHRSLCSILPPNEAIIEGYYMWDMGYYQVERTETTEGQRLSDLLNEYGIVALDFIKIDVQGGEIHVLESMDQNHWDAVLGVNSEAYSAQLYKGGATIADILRLLYERGFELFDLETLVRSRITSYKGKYFHSPELFCARPFSGHIGRSMIHDLVLLRSRSWLLERGNENMIRKVIFIYCLYDYYDHAMDLALRAMDRGIIGRNNANDLEKAIVALHRRSLPLFRRIKEWYRSRSYVLGGTR